MRTETHIDGAWKTTRHHYKGRLIMIKSRRDHGMKCHVFFPDSKTDVDFTLRFSFVNPKQLLEKAKRKIDKNN